MISADRKLDRTRPPEAPDPAPEAPAPAPPDDEAPAPGWLPPSSDNCTMHNFRCWGGIEI